MAKNETTVERTTDREIVVTRLLNAPPRLVFEAWTKAELFARWWVPKSLGMKLLACELDVRKGGRYRLVFEHPAAPTPMEFFGTYLEVVPNARVVWTNEEGGESGQITTVTFEDHGDKTRLVMRELYPSKQALDEAGTGASEAMAETFAQLEELLVLLAAS